MSSPNKKVSSQMHNRKSFLDHYRIGDTVYVMRHKNGREDWKAGAITGRITFLTSYYASVEDYDGDVYTIERVEDIKHG